MQKELEQDGKPLLLIRPSLLELHIGLLANLMTVLQQHILMEKQEEGGELIQRNLRLIYLTLLLLQVPVIIL